MYYNTDFYRMYPMQMPQPMEVAIPHAHLVNTLQHCVAVCYHTMASVLKMPNVASREDQINMLHSCARVCESQVIYLVIYSPISKEHAIMCAGVCEECARMCAQHNDRESQYCSRVCYDCAQACRRYAEMM